MEKIFEILFKYRNSNDFKCILLENKKISFIDLQVFVDEEEFKEFYEILIKIGEYVVEFDFNHNDNSDKIFTFLNDYNKTDLCMAAIEFLDSNRKKIYIRMYKKEVELYLLYEKSRDEKEKILSSIETKEEVIVKKRRI